MLRDPIQKKLKTMETEKPSEHYHSQTLLKSLADKLYFLDRHWSDSVKRKGVSPKILAYDMRNAIKDEFTQRKWLTDENIKKYAQALDDIGIKQSRVIGSSTYTLGDTTLDAATVHGIAQTYLCANESLKRVYKTGLEAAIKAREFESNEGVAESPFNRLIKIISEIKDYSGLIRRTIIDGRTNIPWISLNVAEFYAKGILPVSKYETYAPHRQSPLRPRKFLFA